MESKLLFLEILLRLLCEEGFLEEEETKEIYKNYMRRKL